jgi:hypothetical protein
MINPKINTETAFDREQHSFELRLANLMAVDDLEDFKSLSTG